MSEPEIIGDLHGVKILINAETRHVYLAHPSFPPIKFSIDHPYIQGSRLERDARRAMDDALTPAERAAVENTESSQSKNAFKSVIPETRKSE